MHKKKYKLTGRRIAILLLTLIMVFSFTLGQIGMDGFSFSASASSDSETDSDTETSGEATVTYTNVTGQYDTSGVQTANFSSSVMTSSGSNYETRTVIVSLEGESILEAAEDEDVSDYLDTSAGRKTERNIESLQKSFLNKLSNLGISYSEVYSYSVVDNAVAIEVNTSYVSRIKNIEGVESVVIGDTYEALESVDDSTATSSGTSTSDITNETNVYATGIYDSSEYLEKYGGRGMTVAILDTGLDYTHDAFQMDLTNYDPAFTEEQISALMSDSSKDFNASGDVYVSTKVPFAYDYADKDTDVYPSYSNHGTHVAGIIGGYAESYTDKDGNYVYQTDDDGNTIYDADGNPVYEEFWGVAPYCQLVICKVFTDDLTSDDIGGARTEDILAALEDCVTLGVDIVNMSLGTTCGFSTTNDGDDEGEYMAAIYQAVADADISLIAAASNDYSSGYGSTFGTNLTSNPDSGTVGSPSTYSGALSVASISGKQSSYMIANSGSDYEYSVFFQESSDENSVDYDFLEQMLVDDDGNTITSKQIYYIVIGGVGLASDYTSTIRNKLKELQDQGYTVAALIKRGNSTFQEKVEVAMSYGFDAVVIYNNVAGEIKMTIGDVDDPVPTISITQEAGESMVSGATSRVGTLTLSSEYSAGPFMSSFSSWGVTSDLKLKPEVTAHGGEITSSVPGGWTEMSGTSMATPNVAGLTANVRNYLQSDEAASLYGNISSYSQLTSQLMMSTATLVVDQEGLLYSPRKQGAGLASLDNIVSTQAYLWTDSSQTYTSAHGTYTGADNNLPKIELGDDKDKVGEYTLVFYYTNCSSSSQSFTLKSYFMTETVSLDGYAVGEQAYYLTSNAVWTVNGKTYSDGDSVTLGTGDTMITCTLTLSDEDREYIESNFENGMYVEGFLKLVSNDVENQCDLSIPFLGFYGDWDSAPMLDYDCFEIAEIEQDTSLTDEEKPSESVWATQAYSSYWNGDYVLPIGSYLYTQDEDADQIYTTEEHCSVSCYNDYYGLNDSSNYMTSYEIRGLYAGLLRNARKVTLELTDTATGEVLYESVVYRVNKAYANGGSVTPGFVKMYLSPDELGLVENGQYTFKYVFYFQEDSEPDEDDTFEFSFYVDYTAPVLESATVRYVDYKDGNVTKQRIYLDLTVYDNHYAMAALLCRLTVNDSGEQALELATEYTTPIYNAVKNGSTTVSIEVTDLINSSYSTVLYVELDDYALNHSVYQITITDAKNANAAGEFELADGEDEITIARLATHTVSLTWDGTTYSDANLSNFTWTVRSGSSVVAVKNGTIVGLKAGSAQVAVSNGTITKYINVTVTDSDTTLSYPSISFAAILNNYGAPVAASGTVEVYMEQEIQLEIETDPWYYSLVYDLDIVWKSYNESVAQVDENGNITMLKEGKATIEATISGTAYSTSVTLEVKSPYVISNYSLTDYTGTNSVVYIPANANITTIGDQAFKNNTTVEVVIIPATVTSIGEQAFYGCTNLKYVFFDGVLTQDVPDSALTLIEDYAFYGCTSLEFVDFSNCLTFTASYYAFQGCTSLKFIKGIENMSTAYQYAFEGCTSLLGSLSEDYGSLVSNVTVTVEDNVDDDGFLYTYEIDYANYTVTKYDGQTGEQIGDVSQYTASTFTMTNIAAALEAGKIDATKVKDISDISSVSIIDVVINDEMTESYASDVTTLDISCLHVSGSNVFANCTSLTSIETAEFTSIGDGMFYGCTGLSGTIEINTSSIGSSAFYGCYNITDVVLNSSSAVAIGSYAFYDCGNLTAVETVNGTAIKSIGGYAFYNTSIDTITLSEGLQSLGGNVFAGTTAAIVIDCDLTKVSFDGSTFSYVNGARLTVTPESGLTMDANGVITTSDGTTLVLVPYGYKGGDLDLSATNITKIGQYAFASVNKEMSVILPATLVEIGSGAFASSYITAVTFADETNGLTTIGANAFYGSGITEITLPSSVTSVGSYAFAETPLATFTFAPSGEAEFGSYVFANCTSLKDIALADSITTIGSGTFYQCSKLETVTLPSVNNLGSYTFFGCTNLKSVAYGENASTTGTYTFYSYTTDGSTYTYAAYSKLTSLTLGNNITEISDGAFMNLTALTSIDINGATAIGEYAFYGCSALETVTGLDNVTEIGEYAFYYATSLTELDLASAEVVGDYAFYYASSVETISMPSAKTIGDYSFAGTAVTTVEIPETMLAWVAKDSETDWINWDLSYTDSEGNTTDYTENSGTIYYEAIGTGAFAYSSNLTSFTVASGNPYYFTDDYGVLYRVTDSGEYVLIAYPTARAATAYTVIEGTVRVKAYSFAGASNLTDVTFEHTVTNIGVGAFYDSTVTNYTFLSVAAPVLEAEYSSSDDVSLVTPGYVNKYRGMYYVNFGEIIYYLTDISVYDSNNSLIAASSSSLTITYPSNGTGYTNLVYSSYFGSSTLGDVVMTDTTRELVSIIESFAYTVSDVESWITLEVNDANTAMVTEFSDLVKSAHVLYNTMKSDADQMVLLTEEYANLITELEDALRDVKTRFGYTVSISSTTYDSTSYKSTYYEGETFDITGLLITVTYDDYSTVTYSADDGEITVVNPDYGLDLYDRTVSVYIADLDKTVKLVVTVSEATEDNTGDNTGDNTNDNTGDNTGDNTEDNTGDSTDDDTTASGCGSFFYTGGASGFGGLMIVLLAFAAFVVVRSRKTKAE